MGESVMVPEEMELDGEAGGGCGGCLKLGWGGGTYRQLREEAGGEGWWVTKGKELRGWTEVLGGPKWKSYVRRFGVQGRRMRRMELGYDAESYALNFDDGRNREDDGRITVARVSRVLSCKL